MAAVDGPRGSLVGPCRQPIGSPFCDYLGACVPQRHSALCRPWHPSPRHPAALVSAYLPSLVPTAIPNPSDSSLPSHLCLMCHPPSLSLGVGQCPCMAPPLLLSLPCPCLLPFHCACFPAVRRQFFQQPLPAQPPSLASNASAAAVFSTAEASHVHTVAYDVTCHTPNWGTKVAVHWKRQVRTGARQMQEHMRWLIALEAQTM